jgi:hypothetical protein
MCASALPQNGTSGDFESGQNVQAMQISASNLLVAAQQVRAPAATPAPPRAESPTVTNATISADEPAKFETMSFKTPSPTNNAPLAKPDNPFAPAKRLGSQLDISV